MASHSDDWTAAADELKSDEKAWRIVNELSKARTNYERELEISGHFPMGRARHMFKRGTHEERRDRVY